MFLLAWSSRLCFHRVLFCLSLSKLLWWDHDPWSSTWALPFIWESTQSPPQRYLLWLHSWLSQIWSLHVTRTQCPIFFWKTVSFILHIDGRDWQSTSLNRRRHISLQVFLYRKVRVYRKLTKHLLHREDGNPAFIHMNYAELVLFILGI